MSATTQAARPRKAVTSELHRQRVRSAMWFLLPMILALLIAAAWPLFRTIYYSFTDTSLNDLYGGDYTKAAVRAVHDAMRHSSLSLYWSLGLDPAQMRVNITIGVQQPDKVDTAEVARQMPYGQISVKAVKGGLGVPDAARGDKTVIAAAAIEARYDIPEGRFRLSDA